ncbi:MAG: hypothetical protein K6F70_05115 [Eggerthellaceae bacterium]|jgi:hypothetical protein|uniref:Uncharacterized protein n=1 Tax=Denitrobacterium detoxificans TaxID=79604 RepID=A0A172RX15_9ACTN|nr:hypothetical protein [Denitrobacterium detoxificans]ANE22262.1 3-demethylubiquinone-9 3-methyltransferase [Denitrobacterium detoxificans]MBE6465542.1 hypothetical protein [Denitrobacterium detoxificans]MCR5582967.1 hypothetical protein [Eggerthellaceae bacterium]SEO63334.1 hypothetical protein SAMN02910314_00729 [Denitrobacterium detoxificans]
MAIRQPISNINRSDDYGALQRVVSELYRHTDMVSRMDVVVLVESYDLPADLQEIVSLLPPGYYTRERLCDQLNSAISGHAWGQVYGTVE